MQYLEKLAVMGNFWSQIRIQRTEII